MKGQECRADTETVVSHNGLNGQEFSGQMEVRTPPSDLTTADHREITAMAERALTPHEGDRQHMTDTDLTAHSAPAEVDGLVERIGKSTYA